MHQPDRLGLDGLTVDDQCQVQLVRIVYTDAVGREGSLWWWASAVQRETQTTNSPPLTTALSGSIDR